MQLKMQIESQGESCERRSPTHVLNHKSFGGQVGLDLQMRTHVESNLGGPKQRETCCLHLEQNSDTLDSNKRGPEHPPDAGVHQQEQVHGPIRP